MLDRLKKNAMWPSPRTFDGGDVCESVLKAIACYRKGRNRFAILPQRTIVAKPNKTAEITTLQKNNLPLMLSAASSMSLIVPTWWSVSLKDIAGVVSLQRFMAYGRNYTPCHGDVCVPCEL